MMLKEFKLRLYERFVEELEMELRSKYKYPPENEVLSWEAVREFYYSIRNEHLIIDINDMKCDVITLECEAE